jgi:hypothetical protein
MLTVFVSAVASPWVVPAAVTVPATDLVRLPVSVKSAKDGLDPDSYLSEFKLLKLSSTSVFVSGVPFTDLRVSVLMLYILISVVFVLVSF